MPEPAPIPSAAPSTPAAGPRLARKLGAFDATMLVMGGIIGAGIFMNPSRVAAVVDASWMSLAAWAVGGLIALAGAFIYAELAVWRPHAGGQYVYLRDAFHPSVAFLYGWTLLLVIQTGGMAAVAVTFAEYLNRLVPLGVEPKWAAVATLALLTVVNCFGARAGSSVQATLTVLKVGAILLLVTLGWLAVGGASSPAATASVAAAAEPRPMLVMLGAAMVPVMFAYGGWQTASFVGGEMRDPRRDLPRGLLLGVAGVIALYLAVNAVCLAVLGRDGLAATSTPASDVMSLAIGPAGAKVIAAGIAISTAGFLAQGMLTTPRVFYAMARDGLFFRAVGRVHPRTHAPIVAIVMQGATAAVTAAAIDYGQILNYTVALDAIFFGLTGAALLAFRWRERRGGEVRPADGVAAGATRMPGHPVTTIAFVLAFWALAVNTIASEPRSAGIGFLILLAGLPAYFLWRGLGRRAVPAEEPVDSTAAGR